MTSEAPAEIVVDSAERGNLPVSTDARTSRIVQLRFEGRTWGEIAAVLRCTEKTLWALRRKDNIDALISQMAGDAVESLALHFMGMAPEAARVLARAIKGEEVPMGQAKAAQFAIQTVSKVSELALAHRDGTRVSSRADAVPTPELMGLLRDGGSGENPKP